MSEVERPGRSIFNGGIVPRPGGVESDVTTQAVVPPEVIVRREAEEKKLLEQIRSFLEKEGMFHNIPPQEEEEI